MMFRLTALFLVAAQVTACSSNEYTVGQHKFKIPKSHLITQSLPWLPQFGPNDFVMVANPGDPIQKHILVTIDAPDHVCNVKPQRPEQLQQACAAARSGREQLQAALSRVKRVPDGDAPNVFWDYVQPTNDPTKSKVIVSCFSTGGLPRPADCLRIDSYKNLVVNYYIDERDLARLVEIDRQIDRMLASWEVH